MVTQRLCHTVCTLKPVALQQTLRLKAVGISNNIFPTGTNIARDLNMVALKLLYKKHASSAKKASAGPLTHLGLPDSS